MDATASGYDLDFFSRKHFCNKTVKGRSGLVAVHATANTNRWGTDEFGYTRQFDSSKNGTLQLCQKREFVYPRCYYINTPQDTLASSWLSMYLHFWFREPAFVCTHLDVFTLSPNCVGALCKQHVILIPQWSDIVISYLWFTKATNPSVSLSSAFVLMFSHTVNHYGCLSVNLVSVQMI